MVYLGEGCLEVGYQGMRTLDVCYLRVLCLSEGTEMEKKVPGVMAMGQGKASGHLSQGRMSTAGDKERAAAAGDAGETAACLGSTMRLQHVVEGSDGPPSWWERYFH